MIAFILASLFGIIFLVFLFVLVKSKFSSKKGYHPNSYDDEEEENRVVDSNESSVVHRLCPHNNVVQSYEVTHKDSLDDHLDALAMKLAEKEGRLRISKSKFRETQNEIENLHALDHDVRVRYREIMESLRSDLLTNEKECKKLQDQIEWVSRRRAELRDEVRKGQRLYGEAAAELASNLADLKRGRVMNVTDKPQTQLTTDSVRHRKEPFLPKTTPVGSVFIKSPAGSPERIPSRIEQEERDHHARHY